MALNLYRRHRHECDAGHPEESRSGEFEERKKGWRRCNCQIFASGTIAGNFKRKYTGKTAWDDARAVAAEWQKSASWDGEVILPAKILFGLEVIENRLAERGGFEPPVEVSPYDGLANRCFRPLSHLSVSNSPEIYELLVAVTTLYCFYRLRGDDCHLFVTGTFLSLVLLPNRATARRLASSLECA